MSCAQSGCMLPSNWWVQPWRLQRNGSHGSRPSEYADAGCFIIAHRVRGTNMAKALQTSAPWEKIASQRQCYGMIIDGDQAVKLKERKLAHERSVST